MMLRWVWNKDERSTAFVPFAALLRRELVTTLRRGGMAIWFVLFALASGWFTIGSWPGDRVLLGEMAWRAEEIVVGGIGMLLATAVLIMPGLGAMSLLGERTGETFEQVHLTLLRPWEIAVCKLAGAAGVFVLFAIGVLPAFGTGMFLVGLDLGQIVRPLVLLFLTSVACAAVGMVAGTTAKNSGRAMFRSYILLVIYAGLPFYALYAMYTLYVMYKGLSVSPTLFAEFLASVLPPQCIFVSAYSGLTNAAKLPFQFIAACVYSLAAMAICLTIATRRISNRSLLQPAPLPRRGLLKRLKFAKSISPAPGQSLYRDWLNPIFVRDMIISGTWRLRYWVMRGLAGLLFLGLNYAFLDTSGRSFHGPGDYTSAARVSVGFFLVTVALLTPMLGAHTILREGENLTLLRTTLVRPSQLVRGVTLAALWACGPLFVAYVLVTLPFVAKGTGDAWLLFFTGIVSTSVCAVLGISAGVLASAVSRSHGAAGVMALGLGILLSFALSYLLVIGLNALPWWNFGTNDRWRLVSWISPVWGYFAAQARGSGPYSQSVMSNLNIHYWFLSVAAGMAMSVAVQWLAARVVRRRWERE